MMHSLAGTQVGPAPEMEDLIGQLTRIFERVLMQAPIGRADDFFELGGDSVAAVAISLEIGRELGREVPITALFAAPSIAALAATLISAAPEPFSPLVVLRPGEGNPLFLVHGVGGAVTELRDAASRIETMRPVVGLQACGLDGSEPLDRVEAMAEFYLAAIRDMQPKGPYFLGGYSFGGLVAFEIAQHLVAAGEHVSLLILIDTLVDRNNFDWIDRAINLVFRARSHAASMVALPRGQRWAFLSAKLRSLGADGRNSNKGYLRYLGRHREELPEAVRRVRDACRIAGAHYRPRHYGGSVTLIVAGQFDDTTNRPDLVWRRRVGRLHVSRSGGDHWSLVKDNAAELAARISGALRQAEATDR